MSRKTYTKTEKEKVKSLLLFGKTYKEVRELTNVPKSTISTWFGKTIEGPTHRKAMLEHLANIRTRAAIVLKKKWADIRETEQKEIKTAIFKELKRYPLKNRGFYKSLLAMLYWAEGTKHEKATGPKFANTDPKLALLYITLMRICYPVQEEKFRIGLHIHYYHSVKEVRKFWSKTLQVPENQFIKVYIKKRSKTKRFRRNFVGICFIYYCNSRIRKELIELGNILADTVIHHALVA